MMDLWLRDSRNERWTYYWKTADEYSRIDSSRWSVQAWSAKSSLKSAASTTRLVGTKRAIIAPFTPPSSPSIRHEGIYLLFPGGPFTALCLAAGVDEDWNSILALDAGPKKKPATREEAALAARNHLHIQRKAIERFLLNHSGDARVFDAKLRLARVVAAEGKMSSDQAKVDQALELFADLEKSTGVPREKLADAGFSRASLLMQNQQGSPERTRESIIRSAQNFTGKYPGDRRGPRLLSKQLRSATTCRTRSASSSRKRYGSPTKSRSSDESLTICGALTYWEKPWN